MYKLDLHTHSSLSYDGGISRKQYKRLLENGVLDAVAITDHNETRLARELNSELGDKIIVGEEIKTLDGEIIGLFLKKTIKPGLTAIDTIAQIREQEGLVYIPHPFEKGRDSLQEDVLDTIIKDVDIIETFNARAVLRGRQAMAEKFVVENNLAVASSSDAHCIWGLGTALNLIQALPENKSLVKNLKSSTMQRGFAPFYSLLCPGINKIKNKIFLGV